MHAAYLPWFRIWNPLYTTKGSKTLKANSSPVRLAYRAREVQDLEQYASLYHTTSFEQRLYLFLVSSHTLTTTPVSQERYTSIASGLFLDLSLQGELLPSWTQTWRKINYRITLPLPFNPSNEFSWTMRVQLRGISLLTSLLSGANEKRNPRRRVVQTPLAWRTSGDTESDHWDRLRLEGLSFEAISEIQTKANLRWSLAPLKPIFTSIAFVPAFKTALNLLSWHVTGVIASESLPDHFLPPSLFRHLLVTFSSLSSRSLSRTGKENEQLACQARQRHILVVRRNGRGFLYFDSSALFMFPSPPPRCSSQTPRSGLADLEGGEEG
ncbi:hypothetical protein F5880DRAFT_1613690 [Lentinula raphanica]|nr:hypothetical protein F5880DRAFT_1613690 [Lentinula raphanica]